MGQGLKRLAALHHGQELAEVLADGRWKVDALPFAELAGVEHPAVEADAVNRAEHLVERSGGEHCRRLLGEPVRLAKLHPGLDAKVAVLRAAPLDRVEVAVEVDRVLPFVDEGPVGVLGEGDRRKAELEGALAAAFHRAAGRVPRPFGVHVQIGRQGHAEQASGQETSLISPPWGTWWRGLPTSGARC